MSDDIRGLNTRNLNDGFFDLRFEQNGVFLIVYPPVAKGRRVDIQEVLERLSRKQVKNYDKNLIEMMVLKADKIIRKIAEPQPEIKVDAVAVVNVTPDKMKAFISVQPPEGGRMLTVNELTECLVRNGVVFGVNQTVLEGLSSYPVFNELVCVAEGTPPANGQNGKIEYHFDINKDKKPAILEDGRVDFRELNVVENVIKGQKLCTLLPPLPGIPGKTIAGTDIPALSGKPALLPKGKNVIVGEDGQSLLSAIDGQVNFTDGKISVFANFEVQADVDNSTGNISFIGNVIVRGNVLSGFSIEAGGYVEVWGVVEGAVIKAAGDIIIRRGMQGLGKGVLISGGDIIARYIEHSNIEAKNNIKSEAIMHSNVKCGNRLELGGRKGLLVGGTCKVGKEIDAKVIGSHMATVTDIEVGIDPTLRERYKMFKEETNNIENDLKKAEQAITLLRKLEAAGMMTPDKQEMLAKSVRTKAFFTSRLMELRDEMPVLEGKLQQDAFGKIRAQNFIYPGTKITIGTCIMYVKENLQYCTLYREGADVKVGAIDM